MNLYEILDSNGTPVTGALTYMEAMRYMQTNRLNRNEYSVELHMPKRVKAVEAVEASNETKFSALYELELEVKSTKAMEGFGVDPATRDRAKADSRKLQAKLYSAIDALSQDEAKAYGIYRSGQA